MSVSSSWDVDGLTVCARGKSGCNGQKTTSPKIRTKKKKKPEVNFPNTGLFEMARFK